MTAHQNKQGITIPKPELVAKYTDRTHTNPSFSVTLYNNNT